MPFVNLGEFERPLLSSEQRCDRYGNCAYSLYLGRGACGHYLGSFFAHKVRAADAPAGGTLRDVISRTIDDKGEYEEWYRWQGGKLECIAYRERRLYLRGRLNPQADWGEWESCSTP